MKLILTSNQNYKNNQKLVLYSAKLALKAMPMSDVYIKSLESDVEKKW